MRHMLAKIGTGAMAIATLFICASVYATCARQAEGRTSQSMWIVKQHRPWEGDVEIFMDERAIKFANNGMEIISKFPDWRVVMFRRDAKLLRSMTLSEFEMKGLCRAHETGVIPKPPALLKTGKTKVCGVEANVLESKNRSGLFRCVVWQPAGLPGQESRFISAAFRTWNLGGITLENGYWPKGGPETHKMYGFVEMKQTTGLTLHTKEIRRVPLDREVFAIPKGFHSCGRSEDLRLSQAQRDGIGEFINDVGLGKSLGK